VQALAAGDTPITEIALALGYRDAGNFSRAFRRATGQSPRSFRAARRGAGGSTA
jgi:AraC-like DNA-binding protein